MSSDLSHGAVSDETTEETVRELAQKGYISEPHAAVAYRLLRDELQEGEYGVFWVLLIRQFKENVERILGDTLPLPKELAERADKNYYRIFF